MEKKNIKLYERMIKVLAQHFGEDCEVVLHDFSDGFHNTIMAIENGHVTGRDVGGCITNYGIETIKAGVKGDKVGYITTTPTGKVLRSSTILLTDDEENIEGSICINQDVSKLIVAETAIKNFTKGISSKDATNEVFAKNITELLDYYLQESQTVVGKPVSLMSKDDRLEALRYLDEKGVFLVTKSSKKVCDFFNISKYTLYNQLDQIRE